VFNGVTTNNQTEVIQDVMLRVLGDTQTNIEADIASLAAGGPTPPLLLNGASSAFTIPDDLLRMYDQFYHQAASIPPTTGISRSASLQAGGSLPYANGR
jgi:hypothetical protein